MILRNKIIASALLLALLAGIFWFLKIRNTNRQFWQAQIFELVDEIHPGMSKQDVMRIINHKTWRKQVWSIEQRENQIGVYTPQVLSTGGRNWVVFF